MTRHIVQIGFTKILNHLTVLSSHQSLMHICAGSNILHVWEWWISYNMWYCIKTFVCMLYSICKPTGLASILNTICYYTFYDIILEYIHTSIVTVNVALINKTKLHCLFSMHELHWLQNMKQINVLHQY